MYQPKPLNMDNIQIPKELEPLTELIAKNVHDQWALGRMREGWTFGETRNDTNKKTPCLVPYENLPESEKEYDRNSALQTIKTILALGYKIEK